MEGGRGSCCLEMLQFYVTLRLKFSWVLASCFTNHCVSTLLNSPGNDESDDSLDDNTLYDDAAARWLRIKFFFAFTMAFQYFFFCYSAVVLGWSCGKPNLHQRHSVHFGTQQKRWAWEPGQESLGAIHSTKISGNFGPKPNGSVRSNRKSFEKTGPPFEVDHFFRSDRLELWSNGSRPLIFESDSNVLAAFVVCFFCSLFSSNKNRRKAILTGLAKAIFLGHQTQSVRASHCRWPLRDIAFHVRVNINSL